MLALTNVCRLNDLSNTIKAFEYFLLNIFFSLFFEVFLFGSAKTAFDLLRPLRGLSNFS